MNRHRRIFGWSARRTLATVGLFVGQVVTSQAGDANAYLLSSCPFGGSAVRTITYRIDASLAGNSFYLNRFLDAKNQWNSANIDVKFSEASPTSSYDFRAQFSSADGSRTNWNNNSCPGGHPGSASYLQASSSWNPPRSDPMLNTIDLNHELGHAAGISHVTGSLQNCSDSYGPGPLIPKSVMSDGSTADLAQRWAYLNCGGVLPPYADDKNGVNAVFPGGK